MPHLSDGFIVAKVGIAQRATAPAQFNLTHDVHTITYRGLPPTRPEETESWAGAVGLRPMPTLGANNAPKMGHPDYHSDQSRGKTTNGVTSFGIPATNAVRNNATVDGNAHTGDCNSGIGRA